MFSLSGYTTKEKLYESERSVIYRAIRNEDERPLVFKLLKGEYPDRETISQFNQEYKILKNLDLEGVIKAYGLEKYQHTPIIVLEDFGGEALQSTVFQKKRGILEFLKLALNITEALGQIHQEHIMHLDINPSNILWNSETNQVKIIDFGISTNFMAL